MVNPNKFQAILLNKSKSTHVKETMNIGNEKIESLSVVKLLRIEIGNKFNFNNHINTICRSAANQLNVFIVLKRFLGTGKKSAHSEFCIIKFQLLVHLYGCCPLLNL